MNQTAHKQAQLSRNHQDIGRIHKVGPNTFPYGPRGMRKGLAGKVEQV